MHNNRNEHLRSEFWDGSDRWQVEFALKALKSRDQEVDDVTTVESSQWVSQWKRNMINDITQIKWNQTLWNLVNDIQKPPIFIIHQSKRDLCLFADDLQAQTMINRRVSCRRSRI